MFKKYNSLILILIVLILIPLIIFFSKSLFESSRTNMLYEKAKVMFYEKAIVLKVNSQDLSEDELVPGIFIGSQELLVEIETGKFKSRQLTVRNPMSRLYNVNAKEGMEVVLQVVTKDGEISSVSVYNYFREPVLYVLALLFAAVLIIFSMLKGLKSLLSLIFTSVMVIFFMIPLILHGADPILVSIFTVIVTIIVSFLLIIGFNKKALSAVLGTVLGVACTGIIAVTAGNMAHISGLSLEQAESLIAIADSTHMQIRGLLFSGILIASLGAIMDIGISITSSIYEIHASNPGTSKKDLFISGMNIGKDIMGTMANTLILAFVGGAFGTVIMIATYAMPYRQLMNLSLVSVEFIQGLSASIGIVLTVPITSFISAALINPKIPVEANKQPKKKSAK